MEARLIARGGSVDEFREQITLLDALRRDERVLAQAAEVKAATEAAVKEYTKRVRQDVYLPAVREAVVTWLDAARRIEECRKLVDRIQASGLGANTYCPFNFAVPVTAYTPEAV